MDVVQNLLRGLATVWRVGTATRKRHGISKLDTDRFSAPKTRAEMDRIRSTNRDRHDRYAGVQRQQTSCTTPGVQILRDRPLWKQCNDASVRQQVQGVA